MTDLPALAVPVEASGSAGAAGAAPAPAAWRRGVRLRRLALVVLVLTLLAVVAVLASVALMSEGRRDQLNSGIAVILQGIGMGGLAAAGWLLARQRPDARMAWLMLGTALAWVMSGLALIGAFALHDAGLALAPWGGWLTNWVWVPAQALSMVMLLRFPNGRLPGRRWRVVEGAVVVWAACTTMVTAVLPGELGAEALAPLTNPLGLDLLGDAGDGLLSGLFLVMPVLVVAAAVAPIVRWRWAGRRERGALRWLGIAAGMVAVSVPLAVVAEGGEVLQGLAFLLLPIAIAVAVLRDQLWDLDLRRRYDRLRAVREEERERLRHELHDSLGPVLGSISMRAEAARNLLAGGGDVDRIDRLLASIGTATEGALGEVRRLIDDLGPEALAGRTLDNALAAYVSAYSDRFPVRLVVEPTPLPPLDERAAGTAYLVVVEAVRNAARHSGGSGAVVRLSTAGDDLLAEVRDDGCGISTTPAGVGRSGMARRAEQEGGRLLIGDVTGPDSGTLVRLALPGALA